MENRKRSFNEDFLMAFRQHRCNECSLERRVSRAEHRQASLGCRFYVNRRGKEPDLLTLQDMHLMLAPTARPVRLRKKRFHVMAANDQSENGSHSQPEPPSHGEQAAGNPFPADPAAPQSLGTSDQAIRGGSGYHPEWRNQPDASMVVETDRIRQLQPGANPAVYIVPFAEKPADEQLESGKRGQSKDAQDQGDKPKSNQAKKQDRESKPKDEGNNEDSEDEKNKQGHDEHKGGQSKKLPSTMRTLIFSGIVALVAGLVGAFGYSYFFGPDKSSKSGDQSSSSKSSGSGKSDSGSGKSDSGSSSGSEVGLRVKLRFGL